jgi:cytochrome c-type protein NapC
MSPTLGIVLALTAAAIVLNLVLFIRPRTTRERSGKILAFVGIFVLPLLVVAFGTQEHMEQSKSTKFCMSCHIMEPYGKSLLVDDNEFVPAAHFQNNRIPRERACFTCHTEYTMYGDFKAKLRGLRHVWVQYFGTLPDTIHLYSRYSNRECLHCHEGARAFESAGPHIETPAKLDSLHKDQISCMTSGCHDVVHNVHKMDGVEFWNPDSTASNAQRNGTPN